MESCVTTKLFLCKEHLLGKTLFKMAKVGLQNRGANDTLRNSLCLLGSVYLEKWSQVQTICENSKNNHPMAEEIVQECIPFAFTSNILPY